MKEIKILVKKKNCNEYNLLNELSGCVLYTKRNISISDILSSGISDVNDSITSKFLVSEIHDISNNDEIIRIKRILRKSLVFNPFSEYCNEYTKNNEENGNFTYYPMVIEVVNVKLVLKSDIEKIAIIERFVFHEDYQDSYKEKL